MHIHDRRAVARDGLLRNALRGEAGIALRRRAGLLAGGAGLGFGFPVGILIVVGVFQPMNDGLRHFWQQTATKLPGLICQKQ